MFPVGLFFDSEEWLVLAAVRLVRLEHRASAHGYAVSWLPTVAAVTLSWAQYRVLLL